MLPRAVAARVAYVPGIAFYADGNGADTCGCPTASRRRTASGRACAGWPACSPRSWNCWRRSARSSRGLGSGAAERTGPSRSCWPAGCRWSATSRCAGERVLTRCAGSGSRPTCSTPMPHCSRLSPRLARRGVHRACTAAGRGRCPARGAGPDGGRLRGSSAAACRLAFDKPTAKSLIAAAGMPTPPWVALPHATFRDLGANVLELVVAGSGCR